MRLSEAIRLGSLTVEKPEACNINACAIGMALNAVGNKTKDELLKYPALEEEWPWVSRHRVILCPWCKDGYTMGGANYPSAFLYHPFDTHVMQGDITIDQLADWIASIEPNEPIEKLREQGDEILAAYLPKGMSKQEWIRAMSVHRSEGE